MTIRFPLTMLALLLSLACFGLTGAHAARADEGDPNVKINLARTIVFPNRDFVLEVALDSPATELYAVEFELTFNKTLMTVVDWDAEADGVQIEVGPLMEQDLVETPGPDYIVALNEADNQQGTVKFAVSLLGPDLFVEESGVIARIRMKSSSTTGRGVQSFAKLTLSDAQGQPISVNQSNSVLDVVPVGICGDQDDDEEVTVADVIIDLQIKDGFVDPTASQLKLSDLDNNGKIDHNDALRGLQRIVDPSQVLSSCGEVSP